MALQIGRFSGMSGSGSWISGGGKGILPLGVFGKCMHQTEVHPMKVIQRWSKGIIDSDSVDTLRYSPVSNNSSDDLSFSSLSSSLSVMAKRGREFG